MLATLAGARVAAAQQSGADTLRPRVQALAPVLTTAEALANKLDEVGFTHRRAHSGVPASQFLTRFDIEKRGVTDLAQLLRRMKGRSWGCGEGVLFIDGVLQAQPIPERPVDTVKFTPMETRGRSTIPPVVAVPMPKANPLELIPVNSVDAMEVYSGPSEIPLEFKAAFRQARCVIAVWTR
jgi:hypothetical protein